MSSQSNDEKRKSENDFQECEDVLHQLEKNELVDLVKSCWESKNKNVQSLILNAVSKKQKRDEAKKKQIELDKKCIFETNWIFPTYKEGKATEEVNLDFILNIPEEKIKLGLYHDESKNIDVKDLKWDETDGKLIIRIEGNGCYDCGGSGEVLTVQLERTSDKTKQRVKITSIGECYCMYNDGIWVRRERDADGCLYGYQKESVEESSFEMIEESIEKDINC